MDQGIRYDVIDAVFADKRNDDMVDLAVRCKALAAYVEAGNAEPLVQVSVRVSNLCKKIEKEVAISGALFKDESCCSSKQGNYSGNCTVRLCCRFKSR